MLICRFRVISTLATTLGVATLATSLGCASRTFDPPPISGAKTVAAPASDVASGEDARKKGFTFNVMAPLVLPDVADDKAWTSFSDRLQRVKKSGAYAVSTDVWWGIVEKTDDAFDWSLYLKVSNAIRDAGLKWVPILSFHQCGGNVGDACDTPLPTWLWTKYPRATTFSEHGNENKEAISVWATREALGEYRAFMESFRTSFKDAASHIAEINVSFGPAGELRYPSYNSHDGTVAGYPTRGALQSYGEQARESFREFAKKRHKTLSALSAAWGTPTPLARWADVNPPQDDDTFFDTGGWDSRYGRDFYDWYHESLLERGRLLGEESIAVLAAAGSPFQGVELGAKVPGIHWRMGGDRFAEMNAGLVLPPTKGAAPSEADYAGVVGVFKELDGKARALGTRFVLHFTCLEMSDNEGDPSAKSLAKTLVDFVGKKASDAGVPVKGENALAGVLFLGDHEPPAAKDAQRRAWENMRGPILTGPYRGLTVLRMDNVLESTLAREEFARLVRDAAKK